VSKIILVLIGTSTPLQKILLLSLTYDKVSVAIVFLNANVDREAIDICRKNNVPFREMDLLKENEGLNIVRSVAPDWIFNINSTVILNNEVLNCVRSGALNLHPGKLPEYAGLHTHQWAIRNGEKHFGVTLHWMCAGVDTGDIIFQSTFPIKDTDTGLTLFIKYLNEGTKMVARALEEIIKGNTLPRIKQELSKRRLYRHKDALDGHIRWDWTARKIADFVRAADYKPFKCPTYQSFCLWQDKKILVSKVVRIPGESIHPGRIIKIERLGILVETGRELISLIKIATPEIPLSLNNIESFGIRVGQVLK